MNCNYIYMRITALICNKGTSIIFLGIINSKQELVFSVKCIFFECSQYRLYFDFQMMLYCLITQLTNFKWCIYFVKRTMFISIILLNTIQPFYEYAYIEQYTCDVQCTQTILIHFTPFYSYFLINNSICLALSYNLKSQKSSTTNGL